MPFGDVVTSMFGSTAGRGPSTQATRLPRELQQMFDILLPILRQGREGFSQGQGFVQTPDAPQIGMTGMEDQLQALLFGLQDGTGTGGFLQNTLGQGQRGLDEAFSTLGGARGNVDEAFGVARGLTGRSLNLGDIQRDVEPLLSSGIQNLIQRESVGRRQVGEELIGQNAALGTPLLEQQRALAEQTNRDIGQTTADAIMRERQLRSGETLGALGNMTGLSGVLSGIGGQFGDIGRTAMGVAPALFGTAAQFARRPTDIAAQQFGLDQSAAGQQMESLQQFFNLLLGGVGQGNQSFGTQSQAFQSQANLQAQQAQQAMENFQRMIQQVMSIAAIGGAFCWVAAELYGWGTPEFEAARRYVLAEPELAEFRDAYRREGPRVAAQMRSDPAVRERWRPLFDEFVRRGSRG